MGLEFQEAKSREDTLKKAVADTKAEYDKINARSFEYQQLKREAEADKHLYEELVKKIRESGINAGIQNNLGTNEEKAPRQLPNHAETCSAAGRSSVRSGGT